MLYKYGGGYGVRPSRSLVLLVTAVLAGALIADWRDALDYLPPGQQQPGERPVTEPACFGRGLVFVMRSALLLPTPSTIVPTLGGEVLQIGFRLLGPLLIGLFAFGLRTRVQR